MKKKDIKNVAFPLLPVKFCMFANHFNFSSVHCLLRAFAHFSRRFFVSLIDLGIPLYILGKNSVIISGSIKKNELGHGLRAWLLLGCLDSNLGCATY